MGYPRLQNMLSKYTDTPRINMQTGNDESTEGNDIMTEGLNNDEIIKEKYEFKHDQADRLFESGTIRKLYYKKVIIDNTLISHLIFLFLN
jgi:predicted DsbA family dithiol-disulfide isomerase